VDVRLSDAGPFASKSISGASLKKRPTAYSLLERQIVEYVINRQNDDGGYAFAQGLDSNAQDTYFGLAILNVLGSPFPQKDRTAKWLQEFDLGSIYSYHYISKSLTLCNQLLDSRFKGYVESAASSRRFLSNKDVYVEVSSEFESTLMFLELAMMLKIDPDLERTRRWLLRQRNEDGGFGTRGHSNINSTYHAIASLCLLEANKEDLGKTTRFVRECERPYGGFAVIPGVASLYMEHTYYGVMTLGLLGISSRFPMQTIDFVLKCQRGNGGFARSDLGISTFENTFQAVTILRRLNVL